MHFRATRVLSVGIRRSDWLSGDWLVGFSAGYWHASPPTPLRYTPKTLESYIKMGLPADIVAPTGGRAMMIRSSDEGKTWSKPVTLLDTPDDDRHPAWLELPDGTLLCSLFTYPGVEYADYVQRPEGAHRTAIIRSHDHGQTWDKEPIRLPSPFVADETDGPMVLLKDGTALITISGAAEGRWPAASRGVDQRRQWSDVATAVGRQNRPRAGRGQHRRTARRPLGDDCPSRRGHLLVGRSRP